GCWLASAVLKGDDGLHPIRRTQGSIGDNLVSNDWSFRYLKRSLRFSETLPRQSLLGARVVLRLLECSIEAPLALVIILNGFLLQNIELPLALSNGVLSSLSAGRSRIGGFFGSPQEKNGQNRIGDDTKSRYDCADNENLIRQRRGGPSLTQRLLV